MHRVFFYWSRPKSVEDGKIPTKKVKAKVSQRNLPWTFTFLEGILPSSTPKKPPCITSTINVVKMLKKIVWGVWLSADFLIHSTQNFTFLFYSVKKENLFRDMFLKKDKKLTYKPQFSHRHVQPQWVRWKNFWLCRNQNPSSESALDTRYTFLGQFSSS